MHVAGIGSSFAYQGAAVDNALSSTNSACNGCPILRNLRKASSLGIFHNRPRQVFYDTDDNLENVELTSSTRRGLAQDKGNAATVTGRRLEFADCDVCQDAWYALCAGGRGVCDLVDYGSPFSATAAASVQATCDGFCENHTGDSACFEQCQGPYH